MNVRHSLSRRALHGIATGIALASCASARPPAAPTEPAAGRPPAVLGAAPATNADPGQGAALAKRLRTTPTALDAERAKNAVIERGLYCKEWNEGAPPIAHHFESRVVGGGAVVMDRVFGLMWQNGRLPPATADVDTSGPGALDREEAFAYVKELNAGRFAGFQDWRLPTLEEAVTLITADEDGIRRRVMSGSAEREAVYHLSPAFDWTLAPILWTSDLVATGASDVPANGEAWVVYFLEGKPFGETIAFHAHVRAVRSM